MDEPAPASILEKNGPFGLRCANPHCRSIKVRHHEGPPTSARDFAVTRAAVPDRIWNRLPWTKHVRALMRWFMPWTEDRRCHVAAVSIGLALMSILTAPFMGLTILHQVVLPIFHLWLVVRLGCITVLTVVSINPKANGRWEFLRSLWHEMGAPPMFQRHRW